MRTSAGLADVSIYSYALSRSDEMPFVRYEFDVTTFRDPTNQKVFSVDVKDGRHPDVLKWIQDDERVAVAVREAKALAHAHIRAAHDSFISLGVADHAGKWASAAVAELITDALDKAGYKVFLWHRILQPQVPNP